MVAHRLRSFRRLLQGGLPFSLHLRGFSLCCSRPLAEAPVLDCQDLRPALPTLSRGTLLISSSDFPLPCGSGRPAHANLAQPFAAYVIYRSLRDGVC